MKIIFYWFGKYFVLAIYASIKWYAISFGNRNRNNFQLYTDSRDFCLACYRPDLTASLTNSVPVMTLCMSEVFSRLKKCLIRYLSKHINILQIVKECPSFVRSFISISPNFFNFLDHSYRRSQRLALLKWLNV